MVDVSVSAFDITGGGQPTGGQGVALAGVTFNLNAELVVTDESGVVVLSQDYPDGTLYSYIITPPAGYLYVTGEVPFIPNIPLAGQIEIPLGYTSTSPIYPFVLYFMEEGAVLPQKGISTVGKLLLAGIIIGVPIVVYMAAKKL